MLSHQRVASVAQHSQRTVQCSDCNRSPCMTAAATGVLEQIEAALEDSPDLSLDQFSESPLHVAASHGHVDAIKLLIKEYKLPTDTANFEGWTPLCYAVAHGHLSAAKCLLKNGASPSHVTTNGNTLLHLAAWHGQVECVQWLLQHGMDASKVNSHGCTAFDMAPPGAVRRALYAHLEAVKHRAQQPANGMAGRANTGSTHGSLQAKPR